MDCIVHGVTKSQIQLSDFHFHFSLSSTQYPEITYAGKESEKEWIYGYG